MSQRFRLTRPVEFNHCDPAGIVFYPRYFEMISATIERFLADAIDYSWTRMGVFSGVGFFHQMRSSIESPLFTW